ncbi:2-C-methyl-D-erythritol 4-phosphate cytidylyltransferase [Psychrobacter sp. FDAARGOS_221]|uniref:2-C-methyl-D-erythritol 4-phosphate cytidylyltransferase n=1 Tax=Psychrobacter sp. FDAARGOS_221 TaxID=1975705 RepID=UPI000BB54E2F|nr:2-C-methyl-D-erythritol 4-phosphate cytidylyltransferase [Psychrobacter sp. FDAARGOS_221]PNK60014.1 2-C-methyl-D-erythritol 4-phosphate cytidylyltransferase [Psychrobacter sp. FDAARGOS_221]
MSNSSSPRVFSLIVAAGKGSRFGSSQPKQYTRLKGETILQRSVAALADSKYIDELFLVIASDDTQAKNLSYALPVTFAVGGAERWQSVQSGVTRILDAGARAEDLILIHDAARPCVSAKHIDAVIEAACSAEYGAILGVPVADTLKSVDSQAVIERTVDRSQLWQAQTPQVFRAGILNEVLKHIAEQGVMITDEASAFEYMGYPIQMVQGSRQNIKLTYPEDLQLIESMLESN